MLRIITGKPGAGKTLWTLKQAIKEQAEGRPIFVCNIEGVTHEGIETMSIDDAKAWEKKLPTNAILIIDEAWQVFPQRQKGNPPEYIQRLAVHRHKGVDIWMICQDAMQIDTYVRRLTAEHYHFIRPFNAERSQWFMWQTVRTDRETVDPSIQKKGQSGWFAFDKSLYGTYKSADGHTHKARYPVKKIAIFGAALTLALAGVGGGIYMISGMSDRAVVASGGEQTDPAVASEQPASERPQQPRYEVQRPSEWDKREWARQLVEVVVGMPFTAPIYSEAIEIQSIPRVTGCLHIKMEGKEICRCNTQQGSRVRMPLGQCVELVRNGWFDFMRPDQADIPGRKAEAPSIVPNASS